MSTQPVQQFGRKAQLVLTPNNANSSIATNAATGSGAPGVPRYFIRLRPCRRSISASSNSSSK